MIEAGGMGQPGPDPFAATYTGDKHIHRLHGLAIIVLLHVERLEALGVVVYNDLRAG